MNLLCALPADREEKVSMLRKEVSMLISFLEKKEVELKNCREMTNLKTVEIEEMEKTPSGMCMHKH